MIEPDQICIKTYYTFGGIYSDEYRLYDLLHNVNGPAFISYHDNGNVSSMSWWKNGKLHRIDGPAKIRYAEHGQIIYQEMWENGIFILAKWSCNT